MSLIRFLSLIAFCLIPFIWVCSPMLATYHALTQESETLSKTISLQTKLNTASIDKTPATRTLIAKFEHLSEALIHLQTLISESSKSILSLGYYEENSHIFISITFS